MNDTCFGCLDQGRAISAEEFAASLAGGGAVSGCGQNWTGCGCGETVCCCCRTAPARRTAPQVEEGCCCKESFRAALQLLCGVELSSLLNFGETAFLTDSFVAGATLTAPPMGRISADNLSGELTGTFRRFSPCSCDLLDISAVPYYPTVGGQTALPFTASQVSLCELDAVVIQAAGGAAEGELTAEEAAARNFRRLKCILAAGLNPCGVSCGQCVCSCDCQDCCCTAGVLAALSGSNLSRRVTLTAGNLALVNAELLGTVGNVLVLASDETQRIYFVCAAKVQFLA